jgi:hypothetical protein
MRYNNVTASFIPQPTLLAEWLLKLVHATPLSSTRRTTAPWGNLSPLQQITIQILIHLMGFKIQYNSFHMKLILQNPDILAAEEISP